MYPNLGKVKPGSTIFVPFHTFDSNDPSASVTITGLAVTDIEVYKDASMTQRASDSGYALVDTDGIDLDAVTGIHGVTIDLSDNTTAGFWTSGSNYVVVISSITVDAATINFIPVRFSIGYEGAHLETSIATLASQTSFTLTAGPADNDALNGCPVIIHDVASAVQMAIGYVSDYVGSTKTVTLAADPGIFTMAAGDNISFFMPVNSVDVAANVWDRVLSGATHNIASSAGRRLRQIQDSGLYALASVWVDEVAGTSTGTTSFEDATVTNRANDFDNAQTVADAVDLNSIQITNGNTITLTAGLEGYNLWGNGASLVLGSQNIGGTIIRQFASVTGVGTTLGNPVYFEDCIFGNITIPPTISQRIGWGGTVTIGSAGNYIFTENYSTVAGASAPVLDMGAAVGATTVSFRRWSGGLTINNLASGDVVSIDAVSGGTITLNGADATVHIRGMVNVVNNLTGSPSVVTTNNMDARFDTVDSAVSTVDTVVDNMNSGIITGAAATGTLSTTQATTNLTGYADDQLIGRVIIWLSGDCEGEATDITDYANASGLLTFTALTTAPANGDTFKIV